MDSGSFAGGVLACLRSLLATGVEIAELRLKLLGSALALERRRLCDALVLLAVALLLLCVGLLAFCGFVVLLLWDRYHLGVVAALALGLLGLGAVALWLARRRLRGTDSRH